MGEVSVTGIRKIARGRVHCERREYNIDFGVWKTCSID